MPANNKYQDKRKYVPRTSTYVSSKCYDVTRIIMLPDYVLIIMFIVLSTFLCGNLDISMCYHQ